jgi:uncharacterized membrane protein required for colicin V production
MIAAGIESFDTAKLPFGWFDGVVLILIIFGLFRGRKNGMAKEILPLFLWLGIVFGGAFGYETVGQLYINNFRFGRTAAYISGYMSIALVVWFVFIFLKNAFDKKLTGSGFFGGSEYYLGMVSGTVRYVCLIIFGLALLNAPYYTPAEIQAQKDYAFKNFGGGQKGFSGDYFPTVPSVQEQVFKKSLAGPFIKDKLDILLIESAPVAKKAPSTHS